MSFRWPHGIIENSHWPMPAPVDRRKTKPRKDVSARFDHRLLDPILGSVSPPEDYLEAAPEEESEEE
jgi:hypothetical protein